MAITYNPYAVRDLMVLVEELKSPHNFLSDTFFPGKRTSASIYLDLDLVTGSNEIATYVGSGVEPRIVDKRGYTMKSTELPQTAEIIKITSKDLQKRAPGKTIYDGGRTLDEMVGEAFTQLYQRIANLREYQASESLRTGQTTIDGKGVNAVVEWGYETGAGKHIEVLAGDDLWSSANSDPCAQFREWRSEIVNRSGLAPRIAVMRYSTFNYLIDHATVQTMLDNRRFEIGRLKYEEKYEGLVYYGNVEGIDIYVYDLQYKIDDTATDIMPDKYVLFGSTAAKNHIHHGGIDHVECAGKAMDYFPDTWIEKVPSCMNVGLYTSQIAALCQPNAFKCVQVLA